MHEYSKLRSHLKKKQMHWIIVMIVLVYSSTILSSSLSKSIIKGPSEPLWLSSSNAVKSTKFASANSFPLFSSTFLFSSSTMH